MNWFRYAGVGAVLLLLVGCGVTPDPVVAPAPEPEPDSAAIAAEPVQVEPEPEPEPSLEERWRSPFAVVSRGRPAARPQRTVVVETAASPAVKSHPSDVEAPASVAAPTVRSPATDAPSEPEPGRPPAEAPTTAPPGVAANTERTAEGQTTTEGGGLRTHRVEWGETWLGLVRRYAVRSDALAALNPGVDPERLRAGEVLLIPAPETVRDSAGRTHTVVAGDSLWGISRRYGVSIERLQEVNRLTDQRVRIGQVLIIP